MKKIVAALLIAAIVSIIVIKRQSVPVGKYADFLPSSTQVVFVFNSPAEFFQKLSLEKYPKLFEEFLEESKRELGVDFSKPEDFAANGMDLEKAAGLAVLSWEPAKIVAFLGIADETKFTSFFQRNLPKSEKTFARSIAGHNCTATGRDEGNLESLSYFQHGYWICAFSPESDGQKNLLTWAQNDLISAQNHLQGDKVFRQSINGLRKLGDGYAYLATSQLRTALLEQAEQMQKNPWLKPQANSLKQIAEMCAQMETVSSMAQVKGDSLVGKFHLQMAANSTWLTAAEGRESCSDLLHRLPPDPLICLVSSMGNVEKLWAENKKQLNSMIEQMPLGGQLQNLDQAFDQAEAFLQKNLALEVDLEREVILNFKGSGVMVLYNLPTAAQIDFQMLMALKLKDREVGQKLLKRVAVSLQNSLGVPISEQQSEGATSYSADLRGMGNMAIEPTVGIFQDYLILSSKMSLWEQVLKGGQSCLKGMKNVEVAAALKNATPSAGTIAFSRLVREAMQLVPPRFGGKDLTALSRFLNHIQEISWYSDFPTNNTCDFTISIRGDEPELLFSLLTELEKIKGELGTSRMQMEKDRVKEQEQRFRQREEAEKRRVLREGKDKRRPEKTEKEKGQ